MKTKMKYDLFTVYCRNKMLWVYFEAHISFNILWIHCKSLCNIAHCTLCTVSNNFRCKRYVFCWVAFRSQKRELKKPEKVGGSMRIDEQRKKNEQIMINKTKSVAIYCTINTLNRHLNIFDGKRWIDFFSSSNFLFKSNTWNCMWRK